MPVLKPQSGDKLWPLFTQKMSELLKINVSEPLSLNFLSF